MRAFLVVIVVLIILLYLQYYTKYKHDYQILQVYLDKIKLETLYERYPIVIYDQVDEFDDLLRTLFAYSYVFKSDFGIEPDKVHRCAHKYLLLFSDTSDVLVEIINPKYKKDVRESLAESNVQYVTIKLKHRQVLVMPALWYYHTKNNNVSGIGLDDLVTKWFYQVY